MPNMIFKNEFSKFVIAIVQHSIYVIYFLLMMLTSDIYIEREYEMVILVWVFVSSKCLILVYNYHPQRINTFLMCLHYSFINYEYLLGEMNKNRISHTRKVEGYGNTTRE